MFLDTRWFEYCEIAHDSRPTLICFPHAGGNAFLYRTWQAGLPRVHVYPIQLPGRGRRLAEPSFVRMQDMVEATVQAILPLLTRRFALFGHSMGALLAFEVARVLEHRCQRLPDHVFLAAARAPARQVYRTRIHHLSDPDFITELRALRGTPEELLNDPQALAILLPMLRADFEVVETYRYEAGPPVSSPFTVIGGTDDRSATRDDLEPWSAHTRGRCTLQVLPGDHFFIRTQASQLMGLVDATLDEAARQRRRAV
jgi:medium-chain acyl-[acyl-carrier-protein] hydrolase